MYAKLTTYFPKRRYFNLSVQFLNISQEDTNISSLHFILGQNDAKRCTATWLALKKWIHTQFYKQFYMPHFGK